MYGTIVESTDGARLSAEQEDAANDLYKPFLITGICRPAKAAF